MTWEAPPGAKARQERQWDNYGWELREKCP